MRRLNFLYENCSRLAKSRIACTIASMNPETGTCEEIGPVGQGVGGIAGARVVEKI
jgi:hypothetical protein